MEDVVIDRPVVEFDSSDVKYGSLGQRFISLIIDGLVLAPFTLINLYLSSLALQNPTATITISILATGYKPLMEIVYGATLGKMAMKLSVVNLNFQKADTLTILIRNIFHIIPSIIIITLSILAFKGMGFDPDSGYQQVEMFERQFPSITIVTYLSGLLSIIEGVMVRLDKQKRSLHDRIAGTFVIVRKLQTAATIS